MTKTIPCAKCVGSGEVWVNAAPLQEPGPHPMRLLKALRSTGPGANLIYTCPACGGIGKQESP